ncbi:DUF2723 domain-containing protein [bacterium]|nr:DUF2723 domain-containing protein [bacterium]
MLFPNIKISRLVPAALIILPVALVYWTTLAPGVVQIDSGELSAVQCLAGIAHPTGYPLFTMLGHAFLKLPLGLRPVFQLNVLAMIECILSLVLFAWSASLIFKRPPAAKSASRKKHKTVLPENADALTEPLFTPSAILCGILFLAFSRTFWNQATSTEVYSLHILILSLLFLALSASDKLRRPEMRYWLMTAAVFALGFGNHMTILLALPGIAWFYFASFGFGRKAWIRLAVLACLFLPVLAACYLYLPLRAAHRPLLNWGNPVDFERFFRHVSGQQYRVWLFSSSEAAGRHFRDFFRGFPAEFSWPGLMMGLTGIIPLWKNNRRFSIFLLISFSFTLLYAIHYDIHDLNSYFLLAYICFSFWIVSGAQWLINKAMRMRLPAWTAAAALIGLAVWEGFAHHRQADMSDHVLYEDYTKQALDSLPENSLLLSYQWDCLVSPSYYIQHVEHFRKDVCVVDKELLRRSWYFRQLERTCPGITADIEPEIKAFLKELAPFERGEAYDGSVIEGRFRRMILRMMETQLAKHALFIAPELVENEFRRAELSLPAGYQAVPDGFFFRIVPAGTYLPYRPPDRLRFPSAGNAYTESIRTFVMKMWTWGALYELQTGHPDRARMLKQGMLEQYPGARLPDPLARL